MIEWYKIMSSIAGSLIFIAVVITAYKLIIGGYSIEKRNEAKDSLMRLFFGAILIGIAPLFIKFLLLLNNNLVHIIVGYSNGNLEEILGNSIISNIQTGNAIATAIVIALFAYLFFKLNVKFIIRQFTILIFVLFTPIISIIWMINKKTIGASIWFGQIFINVFMQFIYAFLFLVYREFLPQSGGWAVSILWAMMILPIADVLQNILQNLVSRIAGINNDELANRGIGMAGAMAYSIKTIAYQFSDNNTQKNSTTSFLSRMFINDNNVERNTITTMPTNKMETTSMNISNLNNPKIEKSQDNLKRNDDVSAEKKIFNIGKEFLNIGMYATEGKNFNTHKYNFDNSKKRKDKDNSLKVDNIEEIQE